MYRRITSVVVLLALSAPPIAAEDFYKGKTVSIVVGSTPSGSFDANARALARYMDKYIPGNPTVVVQNMPGAASLTALRYIDSGAPKDGRALGVFLPGLITLSLVTPDKVTLDMRNYAWVGVVTPDNYRVCYGYGPDGVKNWDDLMRRTADKPFAMGTTGKGAANFIDGQVLREVFGANLKIIMGYPGSTEMRLSVERGELDGDCGGYNSIPRNWLAEKRVHVFVRFSESKPPEIPESAPWVGTFAKTDEQRQLLQFLYAAADLGRPVVMSKQVPEDRIEIMRRAFDATVKDAAFLDDMRKMDQPVVPLKGEDAEKVLARVLAASPAIIEKARRIYDE
jgi:tripartite-type tricarboxylate transporter receptor subunit TctC